MVSSMTGYGRSDEHNNDFVLSVEIRSVNSRFLDFSPRLPKVLVPYEDVAYKMVKLNCERGRVSLSAKINYIPGTKNVMTLNQDKFVEYMTVVKDIQKTSERVDLPTMGDILRLPDILTNCEPVDDNKLKDLFLSALQKALDEMEKIRCFEGKNIQSDLVMRLNMAQSITNNICKISKDNCKDNFEHYKERIKLLVEDMNLDKSRLYQEAAILSEKRDITEELVRLKSHFDLFTIYLNSSDNKGKKLNFLLQEMGREINTIGSKSDIVEISHLVVDMKDELEKIREQVQNIV